MMGRTPELTAIEERYPNEWVAVHVTKRDSDGFALDGNVVAHDPNPDIVHEQARAYKKGRPRGTSISSLPVTSPLQAQL